MDPARLLIIGAQGQLGRALTARYPQAQAVDREELDITNPAALAAFDWSKVDTILNAAAYTNVDAAQTPEGRRAAWAINAQAVAHLSRVAIQHNLTLLHISSDYVFDGATSPHTEDEPFAPLGVYAQTKAAGDIATSIVPKHYILRISWLIGDGHNFVKTMIGLAEKNISPRVVHDQTGRLTFTTTLVAAIDWLLTKQASHGTYHVSNDGDVASWADITRAIFKTLGRDDLTVNNVTTEDYAQDNPAAAPRPLKGDFDLTKIKATGLHLPTWRDDLKAYVKNGVSK